MPFAEAQAYFNRRPGDGSSIECLSPIPTAPTRRGRRSTPRCRAQSSSSDWRQRNATIFSALQVERNVMFMILTLIVLVAALNIVSGLIMLVKDKGTTSPSCAPWARRAARSCASS
jgi:lipoprotein-releasing system permease protein